MSAGGKTIRLSPRLESIARMVTPGFRVADIGTDHAYLPIWLCQNGITPSATASDLRSGPLEAAAVNIEQAGLGKRIRILQSDGLSGYLPGETETVVMAGMGGKLICQILGESSGLLAEFRELVLQPQSEIGEVRRFLSDHSYRIDGETCTMDGDKFYPVIRAVPVETDSESRREYTEEELQYGPCLLEDRDPLLETWIRKRLSLTESILKGLSTRSGDAISRRCKELREEERLLKTALRRYEM